MFASGSVAVHLSPEKRSQYMIIGSTAAVFVLGALTQLLPYYAGIDLLGASFSQAKPFEFNVLFPYGVAAALFGTILPPVMFTKGFPAVGIGMGSILSSMELPFAMLTAYLVLGDAITPLQLLGAATIFAAILMLNYRAAFGKK
jgi:drug/metabolite transporter (DMT)-like permease